MAHDAFSWSDQLPALGPPLQNMRIQQQWRLLFEGDDLPMTSLERPVTRPFFEHRRHKVQVDTSHLALRHA